MDTENKIAELIASVLTDEVRRHYDLLEKHARKNAVPPIKGDITLGKLKWRGIRIVTREDFAQAVFQRGRQISPFFLLGEADAAK